MTETSELVKRLLDIALEEPNTPKAKVIVAAADAIERLELNLESRDVFIVQQGLWPAFVDSLPPARAALEEKP